MVIIHEDVSYFCVCVYVYFFIVIICVYRQSGEGPEPETDAGRTEKGGCPCSEADRSRSQRNGEIGEIC